MKPLRLDPGQIEVLDEEMAVVLRQKTEAERLKIASGMWTSARRMIWSFLSEEHPDWDDQKLEQEVARRLSHGAF